MNIEKTHITENKAKISTKIYKIQFAVHKLAVVHIKTKLTLVRICKGKQLFLQKHFKQYSTL